MMRYCWAIAACACVVALSAETFGARHVPVRVFLNGEVVLEGNASDDGRRDADELWNALKEVRFEESAAFAKRVRHEDAEEIELRGDPANTQVKGVTIEVRYGGVAETRSIRILKIDSDDAKRHWRIDPLHVEKLFLVRMVRRSDVTTLVNPRREK